MKRLSSSRLLIVATMIVISCHIALAQQTNATTEIDTTLRRYFAAMSERDVQGLRAVLDKRFILIEARTDNARPHILETGAVNQLLPPQGNTDWDKDKMKIASIKVEVSDPHASVATASVVVRRPLDDKTVAGMQEMLNIKGPDMEENQREAITKWIAARAVDKTMQTMLARQDGVWKIVCLSVPKK